MILHASVPNKWIEGLSFAFDQILRIHFKLNKAESFGLELLDLEFVFLWEKMYRINHPFESLVNDDAVECEEEICDL